MYSFIVQYDVKKRKIPLEIDAHFKLYGKEPWEVDYGQKCPNVM